MSCDTPSDAKTDGDGSNLLPAQETEEQEQQSSRWLYDHSYDANNMPTGVSILLSLMGSVALLVAAAYLRASFRHEREIKLSAYEQTVAEWKKFRSTFARLHINVTAHFGVAPANTSDPELDPNPPRSGGRVMLTRSTDPDPIWDEEGPGGGLPNYMPLKYNQGTAPAPWRTTPRYSQPEEENGSDDSDAAAATESPTSAESENSQDAAGGEEGNERLRERQRGRRRRVEEEGENDKSGDVWSVAPSSRERSTSRGLWWGERKADKKEEKNQGGAENVLPERFIPTSGFDDAPSVRFVFSVRLDPPAVKGGRRRQRDNPKDFGESAKPTGQSANESDAEPLDGGGRGRGRELGWRRWNRWERRDAGEKEGSLYAKIETEWTPLTRIREEHAPMPAPEMKCMQVFGGVHNYKTKMCEVYERLSQVCIQVHIDEDEGIIAFAPVVEDGSAGDEVGEGIGDGKAGSDDDDGKGDEEQEEEVGEGVPMAPRYGCDPRTAWSPWSYAVLQVEGRTATDVIPPPSVSFVETLITLRSVLDPFLHAEALTYTPPNGGGAGGGDAGGGAGGSAGGGDVLMESGGGGGSVGGGGGQFLTFGLSSWSSAVVGCTFLVVGLLLLVQPILALRRWRRRAADAAASSSGGEGRFSRGGGGVGGREGGALGRGKRPRGQWSYGQVDTQWEEESEFSEESSYAQGEVDWARGVEKHRQSPTGIQSVGMRKSPLDGTKPSRDQVCHSELSTDFLRRPAGDASDSGAGEEGGIQLGVMGKGNGGGGGRIEEGFL